ncbi:hypothetical protein KIN20_024710 [Parelaphostrongylus tenuis]|uniref:Uncharacterized protein n=1 Tax=Parelaphostrongylus tenuis TaxID=148309 RepID=A0AAD5QTU4_PARTN|nr:hypothetical protein KIN20_024710 [Parelaphostrongylus tenuis]
MGAPTKTISAVLSVGLTGTPEESTRPPQAQGCRGSPPERRRRCHSDQLGREMRTANATRHMDAPYGLEQWSGACPKGVISGPPAVASVQCLGQVD